MPVIWCFMINFFATHTNETFEEEYYMIYKYITCDRFPFNTIPNYSYHHIICITTQIWDTALLFQEIEDLRYTFE